MRSPVAIRWPSIGHVDYSLSSMRSLVQSPMAHPPVVPMVGLDFQLPSTTVLLQPLHENLHNFDPQFQSSLFKSYGKEDSNLFNSFKERFSKLTSIMIKIGFEYDATA